VAQYAAEKLLQLGAVVLTLSDSTGYIYEPEGFTMEQVQQVRGARGIAIDCLLSEVFLYGAGSCHVRWKIIGRVVPISDGLGMGYDIAQ